MATGLDLVKQGIETIKRETKGTVFAAAEEVRALGTTSADEYAAAILNKNGFGSDTAEIYFYPYAPKGSPQPSYMRSGHNRISKAYEKLMGNPERKRKYDEACFNGWSDEIERVQRIIGRYGGAITIDNMLLPHYLSMVQGSSEVPDYRVHVTIFVPGQRELKLVENLQEKFSDILH